MADAPKPIDPNVAQDLARLALDLSHDKKTRKAFAKIVREAKPDSPHAAAFADVEVEDRFEAFQRAQEEKDIKRQQDAIVERMNVRRQALLNGDESTGRKYSEDDVKKIEALMEKKGLTDYDDAAILYAATLPPENAKPQNMPTRQGSTWEMPEESKHLFANGSKGHLDLAYKVIDEFNRKRA